MYKLLGFTGSWNNSAIFPGNACCGLNAVFLFRFYGYKSLTEIKSVYLKFLCIQNRRLLSLSVRLDLNQYSLPFILKFFETNIFLSRNINKNGLYLSIQLHHLSLSNLQLSTYSKSSWVAYTVKFIVYVSKYCGSRIYGNSILNSVRFYCWWTGMTWVQKGECSTSPFLDYPSFIWAGCLNTTRIHGAIQICNPLAEISDSSANYTKWYTLTF